MKGKRKVISHKWSFQARVEAEANRMMATRSKNVAQRFLNKALAFGEDFEPTGRLAGHLCHSELEEDCRTPFRPPTTASAGYENTVER